MSMNEFLAQYYGNSAPEAEYEKTASEEEQEAQIELFAKLAHDNGIDLEKLSEEQVQELYEATFKEASDDKDEDDKPGKKEKEDKDEDDEKKAEAEAEFAEKKAGQEKIAEADFLGRVMAHSYVNEMRKIAESTEGSDKEAGVRESAGKAYSSAKEHGGKALDFLKDKANKADEAGGRVAARVARVGMGDKSSPLGKVRNAVATHGHRAAAGVAAAGAAGGGVYAATRKKKEASALDELAIERACGMIDEYNKTAEYNGQGQFDEETAADRISAVSTLGLGESTKVASAANADQAVEVRALEYLEAAGYPVTWAE